jgi:DNA uptake protein ComE-like DNA-binding protein
MIAFPALEIESQPLVFDLNAAVVEMLLTIPGVGYAEATAILNARQARRCFRSLEDLLEIPAVRPQTLGALRKMRQAFLEKEKN